MTFPVNIDKTFLIVYKGLEFMAMVKDSLQLHLLPPMGFGLNGLVTLLYQTLAAVALLFYE
jgi:hypothetical protein